MEAPPAVEVQVRVANDASSNHLCQLEDSGAALRADRDLTRRDFRRAEQVNLVLNREDSLGRVEVVREHGIGDIGRGQVDDRGWLPGLNSDSP